MLLRHSMYTIPPEKSHQDNQSSLYHIQITREIHPTGIQSIWRESLLSVLNVTSSLHTHYSSGKSSSSGQSILSLSEQIGAMTVPLPSPPILFPDKLYMWHAGDYVDVKTYNINDASRDFLLRGSNSSKSRLKL